MPGRVKVVRFLLRHVMTLGKRSTVGNCSEYVLNRNLNSQEHEKKDLSYVLHKLNLLHRCFADRD